uniref:hypothetical protein n=1 Tax=Aliarcobacter sp. TaxID=2321116 RepID=UPI00404872BB
MNQPLNEKYEIPFLSEWEDKNENKVTAMLVAHSFRNMKIPVVGYVKTLNDEQKQYFVDNQIANIFVLTVAEFKRLYQEVK